MCLSMYTVLFLASLSFHCKWHQAICVGDRLLQARFLWSVEYFGDLGCMVQRSRSTGRRPVASNWPRNWHGARGRWKPEAAHLAIKITIWFWNSQVEILVERPSQMRIPIQDWYLDKILTGWHPHHFIGRVTMDRVYDFFDPVKHGEGVRICVVFITCVQEGPTLGLKATS